ncbi:MAG: DUF805 domain-containing protein [Paludibacteraceae bacterium]|nr:DUF805 domain-containing protein [Paludibacteraceae bacterium]
MTLNGLIKNFTEMFSKKFVCFEGRAERREYWYFVLCNAIVGIVLSCLDQIWGMAILSGIYNLAVLLPSLGLSVRRLHDLNKSGWFLLLGLIPLVGGIILLVWACQKGTAGTNNYGDEPVFVEEA